MTDETHVIDITIRPGKGGLSIGVHSDPGDDTDVCPSCAELAHALGVFTCEHAALGEDGVRVIDDEFIEAAARRFVIPVAEVRAIFGPPTDLPDMCPDCALLPGEQP